MPSAELMSSQLRVSEHPADYRGWLNGSLHKLLRQLTQQTLSR